MAILCTMWVYIFFFFWKTALLTWYGGDNAGDSRRHTRLLSDYKACLPSPANRSVRVARAGVALII